MKKRICIHLTVIGILILGISNGLELKTDEGEAKEFAKQTSDTIFSIIGDIDLEIYKEDSDVDFESLFQNISRIGAAAFEETKKFDFKNFKDKDLKYAFESIQDYIGGFGISNNRLYEIFYALFELGELSTIRNINDYNDKKIQRRYDPDIRNIIRNSNDPEELQYYWKEWRKITGSWAENIDSIIEDMKSAAQLTNTSALDYWLQKSDLTEMENLMDKIKPLYMELHALTRIGLQKKYGDSIIKPDGLIPHHLFEQVLEQAWRNNSVFDEHFPRNSLPPVGEILRERFNATTLYEIAERFYEKLGFEKFPHSYWNDRIKLIKTENEDDKCQPTVFYSTPKIRLQFCENMTFTDFLNAYDNMGKIFYAKEMTGLPGYFFETYGLDDAIGRAVITSAQTHSNLNAIGMIPENKFPQEIEQIRVLRKAIQRVLNLPLDFVNAKVAADLISGKIGREGLNEHYWHLMDIYAGISPPKNHQSDGLDLPYNFLMEIYDNEMSRKFNMEILSYQIYKKLCEIAGKYPKEPLYMCDLNGNKDAGDALKKMMRLGSSKPLKEVLKSMFPENPTTTAESLLEYYDSIKSAVNEINKKSGAKVGWKSSK